MALSAAFYMQQALNEAWEYQLLTFPNPAVGALILGPHGEILSLEAHHKAGGPHAEVNAFKSAYKTLSGDSYLDDVYQSQAIHDYLIENHQDYFRDTTLFVTLEPCSSRGKTPACSDLIAALKPKKIYIGSLDQHQKDAPFERFRALGIEVETALLKEACDDLIAPFLAWKKGSFNLYKIAQNLNGSFDTGTISSLASRRHVHQIRSVASQMLIGGNTVRIDRPTLDCRLIEGGRDPDVVILSHTQDFEKTIPLFKVPKRQVVISDDIDHALSKPFSLIEGGSGTFAALADHIDWVLVYINANVKAGRSLSSDFEGRIMHTQYKSKDIILWIKRENSE